MTIPTWLETAIEQFLQRRGASLTQPAKLAEAVLQLSTYYKDHPGAPTPWGESKTQIAYGSYIMPLNWLRLKHTLHRLGELKFFTDFEQLIDVGSGMGAVSLALYEAGIHLPTLCIDSDKRAFALHEEISSGIGLPETSFVQTKDAGNHAPLRGTLATLAKKKTLVTFSFSLAETRLLPSWSEQMEGILIVEPGLRDNGRRLLDIRQELRRSHRIWAPCTHEQDCPLWKDSSKDWCHDRTPPVQMPEWFQKMEDLLPFHNGTLTMSYLACRKGAPPAFLTELARLTGDLRKEKGASRQMVCRKDQREFLSWQHKSVKNIPSISRGDLCQVRPGCPEKGRELRPQDGDVQSFDGSAQ